MGDLKFWQYFTHDQRELSGIKIVGFSKINLGCVMSYNVTLMYFLATIHNVTCIPMSA